MELNMMNDIYGMISLPFQGAPVHMSINKPKALPLG